MKTIGILFYKAQMGKPLDMGIAGWTWLFNIGTKAYSHVELLFTETDECFSSTMRDGVNGVRFMPAKACLRHPERWDVAWIEVPDSVYDASYEKAEELVAENNGYDLTGLFGFFNPFNWGDSKAKWYCSEVCAFDLGWPWKKVRWAFMLSSMGLAKLAKLLKKLHEVTRISPRRMSRVVRKYVEIRPYAEAAYKIETA